MNTALVLACLGIMCKGMLGIFTVILVIWGFVALLNRLTSRGTGQSGPDGKAGGENRL